MNDGTSADPSAPIDRSVLEEFHAEMGDDELTAELIELFLTDAPARISAMQEASRRGDRACASVEAHALKGGAGTFGAHRLVQLCGQLEHLNGEAPPDGRVNLVDRITAEYEHVRRALRSFLAELA